MPEALQTERQVLSVSDLTRNIRFILEENFTSLWVEGEVSNFKRHTSGHLYFSLKDDQSQVPCVMFRRENQALEFEMKDGLKLVCFGRVSVYAPRGSYQLYVERAEPKGLGALQLKFQELKEKLRKEGLFDEGRKKPIPYLPQRIGIVTSLDGAALRDILHVTGRRFSGAHFLIYPVQVQGAGSAESIAGAIADFNEWKNADVLIVGRGGGSLEDLWAFNEEVLARAICHSAIPVISAVGHEVDFTIADFVADLRAATPSAAAEMVLPVKEDLIALIENSKTRALQAILAMLKNWKLELKRFETSRTLKNPLAIFEIQFQRLDELKKNLLSGFQNILAIQKEKTAALIGKLEALGPLETLKRGFSVSLKLPEEKILTSAGFLRKGDRVKTRLSKGFFISEVKEVIVAGTTNRREKP